MPISAAFTVNGASNPAEHTTTYGAVVSLALVSIVGADVITWEILAASDPDFAIATITTAGTPPGSTAQFTFPADPGDTIGRAYIVKCTVANALETSVQTAIVGVLNVNGCLPLCPGEEFERHHTHGWGPVLNRFLATIGGSPIGPAGADLAGTFPSPTVRGVTGTAGVLAVHANEFRWDVDKTPSLTQTARTTDDPTHDMSFTSQAPVAGAGTNKAPGNFVFNISAPAATGTPGHLAVTNAGATTHRLGVYPTDTTYGAVWLGSTAPSSSNYAIAGKTGAATHINAATAVGFNIADSAVGNIRSAGLRIGDAATATEKLDVGGNATILGFARAGVLAAKAYLDSYGAFGATVAAVWLGAITPGLTNAALAGDGTTTTVNAITRAQVAAGGTVHSVFTASGLRLGSTSDPTERLEVDGRAKIGVGAGKVTLDGLPGSTASVGAIWTGTQTPSATNFALDGNSTVTAINAPSDRVFFQVAGSNYGNISTAGFRVGDATTATERLEVTGNIQVASATAQKIYQQDNAVNGATAAALTVQAANATGTGATVGADLILRAGTGATAGGVRIAPNGTTFVANFTQAGGTITQTITGNANYIFSGTGTVTFKTTVASPAGMAFAADVTYFQNGAQTVYKGAWTSTGLMIGAAGGTLPSDLLQLYQGNLSFDTSTTSPKIYQRDNVTNGATATTLTLQAANATGTTSTGGSLVLATGTGTSANGSFSLNRGATNVITATGNGSSAYLQLIAGSSANGLFFDSDYYRFRLSDSSTYKGTWTSTGLRVGDSTLATNKFEVAGTSRFGAATGYVFVDNLIGSTTTHGAIWFGNITPSSTNYTLWGNGSSDVRLNSGTNIDFTIGHSTGRMRVDTNGVKIGATSAPATILDVAGRSRFGSATGYTFIDNLISSTTTHGAIWYGNITPSAANATLSGNGSTETTLAVPGSGDIKFSVNGTVVGAVSARVLSLTLHVGSVPSTSNYVFTSGGAGSIYNALSASHEFRVANASIGNWTSTGLRVGDATTAAEKLDVVGNIRIASASAQKIYIQDNIVDSTTGATLTIQGANSSAPATTGGSVDITSGAGLAGRGLVNLQTGATTRIAVAEAGVTFGTSAQAHSFVGSVRWTVRQASANTTLDTTTTDLIVEVDATSVAPTITLPAITTGRWIIIKHAAGANTVSVQRAGSDTIENTALWSLDPGNTDGCRAYVQLYGRGTTWQVIAHNGFHVP
jgi:hypothetical protein